MITETPSVILPSSAEKGRLGVMHMKRYWAKAKALRTGQLHQNSFPDEWKIDNTLLSVLCIGIEPTIIYLFGENETFEEFEDWVLQLNSGELSQERIRHFNAQLTGDVSLGVEAEVTVLSDEDLAFWDKNGYIILRGAIPIKDCDETIEMICRYLDIDRNDPATWYRPHPARQGIMVQLFQHPLLQRNRESKMIKDAYEQLWGRKDIWLNTDRVGFNPPETETYQFPGPRLHWDVSLDLPIPFGTQGILYLADTKPNQGAFTLVPGFQNRVEEWLHSLPEGANPRFENLYALGATPIAANAGDFIIWHHALPHGSSPNSSTLPRIVQYINYAPIDLPIREKWV